MVYRIPKQHPGRGRPRLHSEPFRLADEDTHGQPQHSTQLIHAAYGELRIDAWTELHVAGAPDAPFSVVRVQVERLPNKKLPPRPFVARLDWRSAADRPEHAVALVLAPLHR